MEREVSAGYILGVFVCIFMAVIGLALPLSYCALFILCSVRISEALIFNTGFAFMIYYILGLSVVGIILSALRKDIKNGVFVLLTDCFNTLVLGSIGAMGYLLYQEFSWLNLFIVIGCSIFSICMFILRREIRDREKDSK